MRTAWAALALAAALAASPAAAHAAQGTVEVDVGGRAAALQYDAGGIEVLSAYADLEFGSLVIRVDASGGQGTLEVELPRSLLEAADGGADAAFVVIADGAEAGFAESASEGARTLAISVPSGTEEIEIIGTGFGDGGGAGPAGEAADGAGPGSDEPAGAEDPPGAGAAAGAEDPAGPPADGGGGAPGAEGPGGAPGGPEDPAAPGGGAGDGGAGAEDSAGGEDAGAAESGCGPGTVLRGGICVLDQSCGPGTVLRDGVCVLDGPAAPAGGFRDLAAGAGGGFAIAFAAMIVLWLMGRAGRDRSAPAG